MYSSCLGLEKIVSSGHSTQSYSQEPVDDDVRASGTSFIHSDDLISISQFDSRSLDEKLKYLCKELEIDVYYVCKYFSCLY